MEWPRYGILVSDGQCSCGPSLAKIFSQREESICLQSISVSRINLLKVPGMLHPRWTVFRRRLCSCVWGYPPKGWDGERTAQSFIYLPKEFDIMDIIGLSDHLTADNLRISLLRDFDVQTVEKAAGQTHALFMDGHSSHFTPELLHYTLDNSIEILAYPPHCTHALQRLDVVCFSHMKQTWHDEVSAFETATHWGVNKGDFSGVFGRAFIKAFILQTICKAFKATGIVPFNPNIIVQDQMKLSEPTSTQGYFPMPQPSPVKHITMAFRNHTSFQFGVSTTPTQSAATSPKSTTSSSPVNPNLDPALFTPSRWAAPSDSIDSPSKRMHILALNLAGSSSGSLLLSGDLFYSAHPIPKPVL